MFDEGRAQLQSVRARAGSPDGEGEEREVVRALVMAGAQVDAQREAQYLLGHWRHHLHTGTHLGSCRKKCLMRGELSYNQ